MIEKESAKIESPKKKDRISDPSEEAGPKGEASSISVISSSEDEMSESKLGETEKFSDKIWKVAKVTILVVVLLWVGHYFLEGNFLKGSILGLILAGISFFYSEFLDEIAKVAFWAFLIVVPVRVFLFQPFFVQGASMEPNFYDGEYLIIKEWGYKKTALNLGGKELFAIDPFRELERGDVVVFRYPNDPDKFFIKRVIGLPEEKILIDQDGIKIFNQEHPRGFLLEENTYLPKNIATDNFEKFDLEDDEYVVLGDNRPHSSDSRSWGTLSKELVVGKVWLRAWPLEEFKIFPQEASQEKPIFDSKQKEESGGGPSIQLKPKEFKKN